MKDHAGDWMDLQSSDGNAKSYPLKWSDSQEKFYFLEGPIEIEAGKYQADFFVDGKWRMRRHIDIESVHTLTSFWCEPSSSESGMPTPGLRVYTTSLEIMKQDPLAVL